MEVKLDNYLDFQILHAQDASKAISRNQTSINHLDLTPNEKVDLVLVFWGSVVDIKKNVCVTLSSEQIGNQSYQTCGIAKYPKPMEMIEISSSISEMKTTYIFFTNPFQEPISIDIHLNDVHPEFSILTKKSKFYLAGLETLEIPVAYKPLAMKSQSVLLHIDQDQGYNWTFPIKVFDSKLGTSRTKTQSTCPGFEISASPTH